MSKQPLQNYTLIDMAITPNTMRILQAYFQRFVNVDLLFILLSLNKKPTIFKKNVGKRHPRLSQVTTITTVGMTLHL